MMLGNMCTSLLSAPQIPTVMSPDFIRRGQKVAIMAQITRRTLINAAIATTGATVIARFGHAQEIVSNDSATAVAMGYVADHTSVDTAKWTKKAAPGGENQKCTSCTIYQRIDDDYGLCPIFVGKRVHANGWCNGWVS